MKKWIVTADTYRQPPQVVRVEVMANSYTEALDRGYAIIMAETKPFQITEITARKVIDDD